MMQVLLCCLLGWRSRMSVTGSGCRDWRKSSYSTNGNCVAVGFGAGAQVLVRDTKNPRGAVVACGRVAWNDFVRSIKAG
ncbi:DUF397 domain-containing protein [Sphaerisporangium siamense]|nr:DUF397 domain-containing protein [Sphaerisporangium siamense]